MPKVSVIVPVYGVEKYIERCARSLFEQTLDDIEYLFVDDCTPDKSIDVLKQVVKDYPHRKHQIIIHRMERNSGQAAVRKWGMQNATGEYVIHCDSDDWIDRNLYFEMYKMLVERNADFAVCNYIVHDGSNAIETILGSKDSNITHFTEGLLLQKYPWALWNKMFRRSLFCKKLYYPTGNMEEDMVITSQLVLHSSNMVYVPNVYYYYFYNNASITKKMDVKTLLRNYESMKNNTNLLVGIIKKKDIRHKIWIINGLQHHATTPLLYLMHDNKRYRNMWLNTYPYANWLFIINFYMRIGRRLACILALAKLYPPKKDRVKTHISDS